MNNHCVYTLYSFIFLYQISVICAEKTKTFDIITIRKIVEQKAQQEHKKLKLLESAPKKIHKKISDLDTDISKTIAQSIEIRTKICTKNSLEALCYAQSIEKKLLSFEQKTRKTTNPLFFNIETELNNLQIFIISNYCRPR